MKKFLFVYLLITLIITACAPTAQPTEQPLLPPDDGDVFTPTPPDLTPAQRAAIALLSSRLNLPANEIRLVSTDAVEWPDGCLGVKRAGLFCTQAIVPGFRIILQANGKNYEVRTNKDGTQTALVEEPQVGSSSQELAVKQLASNLGLKESDISMVSTSDVEFKDACLGVSMLGLSCAQVITPGKIIMLEANGLQFEYHINADGSIIQPATLAVNWMRNGGIAGFCNAMTVFLSGEVYASDCRAQPKQTMKTFAELLTASEQKQFFGWTGNFEGVNLDASDPEGVSDRMVVTLDFYGTGKNQPSENEKQKLLDWAQSLYQKLFS